MEHSNQVAALLLLLLMIGNSMSITHIATTSPTITTATASSLHHQTSSRLLPKNLVGGFVFRLIHHSNPNSAFYNANATAEDLIRENARVTSLRGYHLSMKIAMAAISNEFSMDFGIGTPAIQTAAIVDTGSYITWVQCSPCHTCYEQRTPMFYPGKSSSYKEIRSSNIECAGYRNVFRCHGDSCTYAVTYGDELETMGVVSTETIYLKDLGQLGGDKNISDFVFGCGYYNTDTAKTESAGIVGLGHHPLSLVGQLGNPPFSFCVTPDSRYHPEGSIHFGPSARLWGDPTPMMLSKYREDGNYYISLEKIIVDKVKIQYEGGMLVDSGSAFTLLHEEAYNGLVRSIKEEVSDDPVLSFGNFELCYREEADKPKIKFQFKGYLFEPSIENTWIRINPYKRCLGILKIEGGMGIEEGISILGMRQLWNVNVGFDINKKQIMFKHTRGCDNEGY